MVIISAIPNVNFKGITKINENRPLSRAVAFVDNMMSSEESSAERLDVFDAMGQIAMKTQMMNVLYDVNALKYESQKTLNSSQMAYDAAKIVIGDIKAMVLSHNNGDEFYDDMNEVKVLIDGQKVKEFNENGQKVREATISADGSYIEKIEEKLGNTRNRIERTESGIKIIRGMRVYPNGVKTAKRILYFDDKGNLTDCVKNFKSKENEYGEVYYRSYDKSFEFQNGILKRITTGAKITPNKKTFNQDIYFSKTGIANTILEKYINKQGNSSVGERYTFKEEETKMENSINCYETNYRLFRYNGRKNCATKILISSEGKLLT